MTRPALPDWRAAMPWPGVETHKHARGRLGVVSGKASQTGAARLAARAGLRIGAGVVRILCPPDATAIIAPAIEAIMLTPFSSDEALAEAAANLDAVVIGPAAGVNDATRANVHALAGTGAALVVDADGLTVFEGWPGDLFDALDRDDVLTPHEGEFRRLFPGLLEQGREAAAAGLAPGFLIYDEDDQLAAVREAMRAQMAQALQTDWAWAFDAHKDNGAYRPDPVSTGRRALAGMALTMSYASCAVT